MNFYNALQLNPGDLKNNIKNSQSKSQKRFFTLAIIIRAVLIVLFSIVFIAPVAPIFGTENNCVAVALLCILLSVRFVDFGYCLGDALFYMAICFFTMVFAPALAEIVGTIPGLLIHFVAIFMIIAITSEQPEMGNGGLYAFSYVFLVGNPVSGVLLTKRFELMTIGYILCAVVYFYKHKGKHSGVRFKNIIKEFRLTKEKCQWQLQLSLGVSVFLALGAFFRVERFMWAGFACASLLGYYTTSRDIAKERMWERIAGVIIGSFAFYIIYALVPPSMYGLFGPVGGILLGFCSGYKYKTALNCFGALLLATGLYGLGGSVILRIANNIAGAVFGFCFMSLYGKLMNKHFKTENARD